MANITTKIRVYLETNGKDWLQEKSNKSFKLQDNSDGSGIVIVSWNVAGLAQPTEEQLDALDAQATTLESNNQVINTRIKLYGTTAEQLEYIVENGVDSFIAKQNQIKTDNPKS
jgi:hypothetical protein